jgi:hypothetical protein
MVIDDGPKGEIGKGQLLNYLWATYLPKNTRTPPTYLPKSYLWSTHLSTHGLFKDYLEGV